MKYRKKPVIISAWKFERHAPVPMWVVQACHDVGDHVLTIPTLEGTMTARLGDWIIQGVKGEVYPCKPDIFEATYDAVAESGEQLASATDRPSVPPLDEKLKDILGMMITQTAAIGRRLDALQLYKVPRKVEEEHAAALHWMLNLYFTHGDQWRSVGTKILENEAQDNGGGKR